MIDRYGLHLKVIHNDVTDRLAQLMKQCSYYLQQQQKPMEVSIGIVYICKCHVNLLLDYFNVYIRIQGHKCFITLVLCNTCLHHRFFPMFFIIHRGFMYFIFYLNGIKFISFAHVLKVLYGVHLFHFRIFEIAPTNFCTALINLY